MIKKRLVAVFTTLVIASLTITSFADNGVTSLSVAVLAPTTNAPAGAQGLAAFGFGDCFSTNAPNLHVGTIGLLVGTYSVSVTDVTGTNTYALGTFDVQLWSHDDWTNAMPSLAIGGGEFALPDGVSPTNIVSISISDSNTLVDLTGTFTSPTNAVPQLDEEILLTATNDAPTGTVGRASIETDEEDGNAAASVHVGTVGLLVGTYTVSVADETGTNIFPLGSFAVDIRTNQCEGGSWWTTNPVGRASFPLPDGLAATNVTTISVTDSNGVVDLVGDFTNATNTGYCAFAEHVALEPGLVCTNLQGNALLHLQQRRGKAHNQFALVAHGAPANQTLDLLVNGATAGTVRSNRRGDLKLNRLPKGINLLHVTTVQVRDPHGNIVFTANF